MGIKYFAKFDESGFITESYPSDIYPFTPAGDTVEITAEDLQKYLSREHVRDEKGRCVPRQKTFGEIRNAKLYEINKQFFQAVAKPISVTVDSGTFLMDAKKDSASSLLAAVEMHRASGDTHLKKVVDYYNQDRPGVSLEEAEIIAAAQSKTYIDHFYRRAEKRGAVLRASTVEQIQAITW